MASNAPKRSRQDMPTVRDFISQTIEKLGRSLRIMQDCLSDVTTFRNPHVFASTYCGAWHTIASMQTFNFFLSFMMIHLDNNPGFLNDRIDPTAADAQDGTAPALPSSFDTERKRVDALMETYEEMSQLMRRINFVLAQVNRDQAASNVSSTSS
ncbi:uncharacterized protein LOC108864544 [Galendromus occidentalis]|uniref:Uncharacterized protein LOC108864544 n=1 Tax=Galendromus occidentalis TaxID=34638 RepID=A0AAJ7L5Y9_9ACAR|nr:uncharacterized protein LOC108864544 [Galendromus occidentalis]